RRLRRRGKAAANPWGDGRRRRRHPALARAGGGGQEPGPAHRLLSGAATAVGRAVALGTRSPSSPCEERGGRSDGVHSADEGTDFGRKLLSAFGERRRANKHMARRLA